MISVARLDGAGDGRQRGAALVLPRQLGVAATAAAGTGGAAQAQRAPLSLATSYTSRIESPTAISANGVTNQQAAPKATARLVRNDAVNVERTSEGVDVKIRYDRIKHLPEEQLAAFQALDKDKSGSISLGEMLSIADSHASLQQQVFYLSVAVLSLLLGIFLVSWGGAVLAQVTATTENALTVPGGVSILNTGTAHEEIALQYASLLDKAQLSRVHSLTLRAKALVHFDDAHHKCEHCPDVTILKIKMVQKYNDSYVEFIDALTKPTIVIVDQGHVTIHRAAFDMQEGAHATKLTACGIIKCSTLTLDGTDLKMLDAKAKKLGLGHHGGRRNPRAKWLRETCVQNGGGDEKDKRWELKRL